MQGFEKVPAVGNSSIEGHAELPLVRVAAEFGLEVFPGVSETVIHVFSRLLVRKRVNQST